MPELFSDQTQPPHTGLNLTSHHILAVPVVSDLSVGQSLGPAAVFTPYQCHIDLIIVLLWYIFWRGRAMFGHIFLWNL